jgi:hypothetical protein
MRWPSLLLRQTIGVESIRSSAFSAFFFVALMRRRTYDSRQKHSVEQLHVKETVQKSQE